MKQKDDVSEEISREMYLIGIVCLIFGFVVGLSMIISSKHTTLDQIAIGAFIIFIGIFLVLTNNPYNYNRQHK